MPAESGMFLFDFAGGISPRGFWKKTDESRQEISLWDKLDRPSRGFSFMKEKPLLFSYGTPCGHPLCQVCSFLHILIAEYKSRKSEERNEHGEKRKSAF